MKKMLVLFALCFVLPSMAMEKKYSEEQLKANQQLIEAIQNKNLKKAQDALNDGADINVQEIYVPIGEYDEAYTLLHFAASESDPSVVDFLIRRGANVNIEDPGNGITPLHRAIYKGDKKVVKMLLDAGADVNVAWEQGTPLEIAVDIENDHKAADMVQLLLDNGALLLPEKQTIFFPELRRKIVTGGVGYDPEMLPVGQVLANAIDKHGHNSKTVRVIKEKIKEQTLESKNRRKLFRLY